MSGPAAEAPAPTRRALVAAQLLAVLVLAVILFPAISPARAVTGGPGIKLLFLCRIPAVLVVATVFLRMRGLGWRDLGLRRPRWRRFGLSLAIGFLATLLVVASVREAARRLNASAADYSMFAPLQGNLALYLYWLVPATWGSAALGEELLARGFILDALERIGGGPGGWATPAAILVQALLFGLMHLYQGPAGAANAAAIGLVLGVVWLASGRNLWAGIVIHGLVDSLAMTVIFLGGLTR